MFNSAEFNGVNLLGTTASLTLQIGFKAGNSYMLVVSTIDGEPRLRQRRTVVHRRRNGIAPDLGRQQKRCSC